LVAAALMAPQAALADTTTSVWNGATADWAVTTNWTPNTVPSATVSAVFNAAFTNQPLLTAASTAQGIWVTGASSYNGGTVTISGNQTLAITGTATLNSITNAGILLDGAGNENLTISGTSNMTVSNSTSFLVNNAGTLTIAKPLVITAAKVLTLGGTSASGNIVISGATTNTTGAITVNTAGTVTLSGANLNTGLTTVSAGTLSLTNALALQNSALVTTGAGTVTLSGVTTPTFGGLSGATGNLATVISSGYTGSVTALTLNPLSGSVTYGGAIANGVAGMTLTKTGAGTQILSGANSYSGGTQVLGGTLTANVAGSLGTGAVNVDKAILTLALPGATSFSSAGNASYTAVNGAQVNIATQNFTNAGDTFNIAAGNIIAGNATTTANNGINSLTRVSTIAAGGNVVLAPGSIVAFGGTLTTGLGTGILTLKSGAGTAADLYFGLAANTVAASTITVGTGTPWSGISTDRTGRNYLSGTITANSDFNLQGFAVPGAAPVVLNMGSTGAMIVATPNGNVNANIIGSVTWTTASTALGSANNNLNFVVTPGSTFTLTPANALGASAGSAVSVSVQSGGKLAIGNGAAINAATTILPGGMFTQSLATLTGTGTITHSNGSILNLTSTAAVSGATQGLGTVPGTIVRMGITGLLPGTSAGGVTQFDSRLNDAAIYELTAGVTMGNAAAATDSLFTLNASSGIGGILTNDATTRTLTGATGTIVIGANGGTVAATTGTTLTVSEDFTLGGNLTIGTAGSISGNLKLGAVTLSGGFALGGADRTITVGSGLGTVTLSGALSSSGAGNKLTLAGSGPITVGAITPGTNNPAIEVSGTSTYTFSGASTFTGATTISAGTLSLGNSLALQNSALDTTASIAGDATNGLKTTVTTLTFGGLNGNKDLASVFTTASGGYSGVTALTLNPGAGATPSYSGAIADGAAGMTITKTGAGTQTLSGANTYTGLTTVSAGILTLGHASNTIADAAAVQVSGGTLDVANPDTVGAVTLSSGTISGVGTLTGSSYALTNTGLISANLGANSATLTKTGAGTATLSGTNAYTGETTVNAGTLVISGSPTGTGAVTVNGGTLDLGGGTATGTLLSTVLNLAGGTFAYTRTGNTTQGFTTTNIIAGAGTSAVSAVAGDTLTLGSLVRGVGGTVDIGNTGTITTSTANDATGILGGWATFGGTTWAVANGPGSAITGIGDEAYIKTSVALNDPTQYAGVHIDVDSSQTPTALITPNSLRFNTAGAYTLTLQGTNVLNSGGILVTPTVGANLSTITGGTLAGAASGNLVVIQNNTNTGGGLTIASNIVNNTGATGLTKSGAGLLTLTGANTYTGATTVGVGTLEIGGAGQLNSGNYSAGIAVGGGATFKYNSSANQVLGGAISGDGGLAKDGAGNLTLSAVNTYTGATTITTGTLEIGGAGQLGGGTYSNTITISPGATFKYNSSADQTLSSGGTGGVLRGGGGFIKDGAGTLTVSEFDGPDPSGNLFTGSITINKGTLKMVGGYAFFNNECTYSIASGAVLHLASSEDTYPATGTTGTTINGAGTLRISDGDFWDYYKTAIVKFQLGSGGLIDVQQAAPSIPSTLWGYAFFDWTNNLARLNVDGVFDLYRGPSVFADALTGAGTVTRTYAGTGNTLTVGVANGSGTFSGTIAGSVAFTKTGTGTQTLTGTANTYTGATLVSAGTLAVSGAGSINTTSGITINGPTAAFMQNGSVPNDRTFTLIRGTLGGTGTISTAITIGPNVTLAPGDRTLVTPAAGTLTITNAVNLAGETTGGTTEMRLFSATGSDSLLQSTTGGLTYGGILKVIDLNPTDFAVGNHWDLFDFDSQSGTFSNNSEFGTLGGINLPLLTAGKKWSFDYDRGVLSVVLGVVPGDTNSDGVVDAADFIALKKNFGAGPGASGGATIGDFNASGTVDWNDLSTLMTNMGSGSGAPAVTPEPCSAMLLVFGAAALLRRRRKA
jgi:autotransporter-associated beta strand protein